MCTYVQPKGCAYAQHVPFSQIEDLCGRRCCTYVHEFPEGMRVRATPKVRARFVGKKILQICHRLCLLTFGVARTRNTSPSRPRRGNKSSICAEEGERFVTPSSAQIEDLFPLWDARTRNTSPSHKSSICAEEGVVFASPSGKPSTCTRRGRHSPSTFVPRRDARTRNTSPSGKKVRPVRTSFAL